MNISMDALPCIHIDRMPRISSRILRQARAIHPLLPSLLPACRDLHSAQNELRWLGQHALSQCQNHFPDRQHDLLRAYVKRRARGEPLQYILGTEYFGNLEIICRPGVLIPRFVCVPLFLHNSV